MTAVAPELFDTLGSTTTLQAKERTDASDTVDIWYQLRDPDNANDTIFVQYRQGAGAWGFDHERGGFGGGGGEVGWVSEQPNKWEHDQDSHGTHVTSTVIGYNLGATHINGVAPMTTIIPVNIRILAIAPCGSG
jgi:hypothetical protein